MNSLVHDIAPDPKPLREVSLKRSGVIPPEPGAVRPPIATRTRRHSLPRVRATLSGRRRTSGLPGPSSRATAGDGVSPIASGASRGVAILARR